MFDLSIMRFNVSPLYVRVCNLNWAGHGQQCNATLNTIFMRDYVSIIIIKKLVDHKTLTGYTLSRGDDVVP